MGFSVLKQAEATGSFLDRVDSEVFSLPLQHFARGGSALVRIGASCSCEIGQAGTRASREWSWRASTLSFSLPDCPELQPCERLWLLTNEAIANRRGLTLSELQEVQAERCVVLADEPLRLRQYTLYSWWPRALRRD